MAHKGSPILLAFLTLNNGQMWMDSISYIYFYWVFERSLFFWFGLVIYLGVQFLLEF